MSGKLCFLIFGMCLAKNAVLGSPVPYRSCRNSYPYVGTKTSYSNAYNDTGETMALTSCKPMQIWMMCRHGTRYPGKNRIAQILNLTHIRDQIITISDDTCMCKHLYGKRNLKNWKPYPELVPGVEKYLAVQGEKDIEFLAERIKTKLPTLFDKNVTKTFEFRSTATQRTIFSMKSFIKGALDLNPEIPPFNDRFYHLPQPKETQSYMYGSGYVGRGVFTHLDIEIVPSASDTLLKMYDTCDSWKTTRPHKEVSEFIDGPEMEKVVADVSRRLGFAENISIDYLFLFYDTCRFERAWHLNESSPWCDVFTDDEMRVLEYEEDLYYYYDVGPGRKINGELGCHPIRDMFDHFAKLEAGDDEPTGDDKLMGHDEPTGVVYFTHSHMMTLFLTAMGIGKDSVPLTAANFQDMDGRNWRISQMVPFAANVVAVFHRCDSSDTPFKVAFYLNEKPLTLEGCENGVCDWAQLKKKLGAIAANCSVEICQKNRKLI